MNGIASANIILYNLSVREILQDGTYRSYSYVLSFWS